MSNMIDRFFKNIAEQEKYVISINDFQGKQYLDIRLFYKPDGQGDFIPTKKGVSLSVYHLGKLKDAIENVTKHVEGI